MICLSVWNVGSSCWFVEESSKGGKVKGIYGFLDKAVSQLSSAQQQRQPSEAAGSPSTTVVLVI